MNLKKINSADNAKIKLLKKLSQKKYRQETGLFLVENPVIIRDALKAGVQFESLFVADTYVEKNKDQLEKLISQSPSGEYFAVSDSIYKSFTSLETPPGIGAVYRQRQGQIDYNSSIVYLNAISDPGNLGAILRSALAFGLKNIVVDNDCADIYNPKTLQAAKNSVFHLNITEDSGRSALTEIKKKMKVYSTRLQEGDSIEKIKSQKKVCVVLGNETRGVSKEIQDLSDGFIKIKISPEMESLNVASTAAIVFHELSR